MELTAETVLGKVHSIGRGMSKWPSRVCEDADGARSYPQTGRGTRGVGKSSPSSVHYSCIAGMFLDATDVGM